MEILRYTVFPDGPDGGNPAGVVPDVTGLTDEDMLGIAADLGYSETAFVFPTGDCAARVRYFAPLTEVDFCGHATIATAVDHARRRRPGLLTLTTDVGVIDVVTSLTNQGVTATMTGNPVTVTEVDPAAATALLTALRLGPADLDPELPLRVADHGNAHPVLGVTAAALDALDHDDHALIAVMRDNGWTTTVNVVHRLGPEEFEARNPFPLGGIREDPATGSAAMALGGYLAALGLVQPPARVLVRQGRHIDRPSRLVVDIPVAGGISVTGTATPLPD